MSGSRHVQHAQALRTVFGHRNYPTCRMVQPMPCCFVLLLGFFGPRLAFLFLWLFDYNRIMATFNNFFLWPLLALIFLPWTGLAYTFAWSPMFGVTGVGWVVVLVGLILDIATYSGRAAQNRYQSSTAA